MIETCFFRRKCQRITEKTILELEKKRIPESSQKMPQFHLYQLILECNKKLLIHVIHHLQAYVE